ncbi:hypothetical protein BJY01DRAFT_261026 [Aspergillus pseudoustus]|uniref:TauD/TfdA-like domain-containing protein n=1 Tax=Aspergillus pseudoustus TaxID=1810923 RepID=A0ABR4IQR3_9EURO
MSPPQQQATCQAHVHTATHIPGITAPSISYSNDQCHVSTIHDILQDTGVLRIRLEFEDDECLYLRGLLRSLHTRHGHNLPLHHSTHRGWFWNIKPSQADFQRPKHQARSETMDEFPWHTDCSYEGSPPRFFALQVIHPDQFDGGILSLLKFDKVLAMLSRETVAALARPEYRILVPPEFRKAQNPDGSIIGCLLALESRQLAFRYREDITQSLTRDAELALEELRAILLEPHLLSGVMHLTSEILPRGSILLIDNRLWLHRRTEIKDPNRHLKRVRWDGKPFSVS